MPPGASSLGLTRPHSFQRSHPQTTFITIKLREPQNPLEKKKKKTPETPQTTYYRQHRTVVATPQAWLRSALGKRDREGDIILFRAAV